MKSTNPFGLDFPSCQRRNGCINIVQCRMRTSCGNLTATDSQFCWGGRDISHTTSARRYSQSVLANRENGFQCRLDGEGTARTSPELRDSRNSGLLYGMLPIPV